MHIVCDAGALTLGETEVTVVSQDIRNSAGDALTANNQTVTVYGDFGSLAEPARRPPFEWRPSCHCERHSTRGPWSRGVPLLSCACSNRARQSIARLTVVVVANASNYTDGDSIVLHMDMLTNQVRDRRIEDGSVRTR
jgi:hypothetical protein